MMAGGMKAAAVAERLAVGRATLFRAIQREVNK
jgi:hypothetical protein